MEKLFKLLEDTTNIVRGILLIAFFVALIIIIFTAYQAFGVVKDFFTPEKAKVELSTNLVAQTEDDLLITSKAAIDVYQFYRKKDGKYILSGETLNDYAGKEVDLKDNGQTNSRQYCQYGIDITLGFHEPQQLSEHIFSGQTETKLPEFIGIYVTNRISAPQTGSVISNCNSKMLGSKETRKKDEATIESWLARDDIFQVHMKQGVETFYQYLMFNADTQDDKEKAQTWRLSALKLIKEKLQNIVKREVAQSNNGAPTNNFLKRSRGVTRELAKAFSSNSNAILTNSQEEIFLPSLAFGSYIETYSTMAFIDASRREWLFFNDQEFEIKRDVTAIVYGAECTRIKNSLSYDYEVIATSPQIIFRNTLYSELGIFHTGILDNLVKQVGMPIDAYLQKKIRESQDMLINKNAPLAINAAKRAFERQVIKSINTKRPETKTVDFKYVNVDQESPSLYESSFEQFVRSLVSQ